MIADAGSSLIAFARCITSNTARRQQTKRRKGELFSVSVRVGNVFRLKHTIVIAGNCLQADRIPDFNRKEPESVK